MLSVILCTSIIQSVTVIGLVAVMMGLRDDVRILQRQVTHMTTAQDAVAQDIATIKGQVVSMAAAYATAAAAAQAKALADAKAAWEADDEVKWQKAHADLGGVISAMNAGQPIIPPATPADPSPAPVAPPVSSPAAPAA